MTKIHPGIKCIPCYDFDTVLATKSITFVKLFIPKHFNTSKVSPPNIGRI